MGDEKRVDVVQEVDDVGGNRLKGLRSARRVSNPLDNIGTVVLKKKWVRGRVRETYAKKKTSLTIKNFI